MSYEDSFKPGTRPTVLIGAVGDGSPAIFNDDLRYLARITTLGATSGAPAASQQAEIMSVNERTLDPDRIVVSSDRCRLKPRPARLCTL